MRQLSPDFYDGMHAKIDQSVTRTRYDGLFRKVLANIRSHGGRSILEVGCGEGMMFDGTATSRETARATWAP